MAGDWIKVEHALPDKPEVIRMAARLSIDQDAVTGKLLRFWIWADQQTIAGDAPGVTSAFIDRLTNCSGFALALVEVGWLVDRNGRLKLPHFDRHNGQTAKNRALTKDRMKRSRDAASVTESSPEKRREEKSKEAPTPPDEKPWALLKDPEEFLAEWNANPHTRKAGPTAAQIPLQSELTARLSNPAWVDGYPRALAKLPLRAHADDPTISIKFFLQEDTVALILSGEFDYDKRPRGRSAQRKPEFDLNAALEASRR